MDKRHLFIATPSEALIRSFKEEAIKEAWLVESVPYFKGILPMLEDRENRLDCLVLTDSFIGEEGVSEEEFVHLVYSIRMDNRWNRVIIIFLSDLPLEHSLFSHMISLGIYNIINRPKVKISEVLAKYDEPLTLADVRHLLPEGRGQKASLLLGTRLLGRKKHDAKSATSLTKKEIEKEIIEIERRVSIKQRDIAVISFYSAGASFVAGNMAAYLARKRMKTTLWDGDFRGMNQFYLFGMDFWEKDRIEVFQGQNSLRNYQTADWGYQDPDLPNLFVYSTQPGFVAPEYGIEEYLSFYEKVRPQSEYFITDLSGNHTSELGRFILRQATDIFIVVDQNVAKWFQHTEEMNRFIHEVNPHKCRWIMNSYEVMERADTQQFTALFGVEVSHKLPEAFRSNLRAIANGRPLLLQKDEKNLTAAIEKMLSPFWIKEERTAWFKLLLNKVRERRI